jgi:hypothetical protein
VLERRRRYVRGLLTAIRSAADAIGNCATSACTTLPASDAGRAATAASPGCMRLARRGSDDRNGRTAAAPGRRPLAAARLRLRAYPRHGRCRESTCSTGPSSRTVGVSNTVIFLGARRGSRRTPVCSPDGAPPMRAWPDRRRRVVGHRCPVGHTQAPGLPDRRTVASAVESPGGRGHHLGHEPDRHPHRVSEDFAVTATVTPRRPATARAYSLPTVREIPPAVRPGTFHSTW